MKTATFPNDNVIIEVPGLTERQIDNRAKRILALEEEIKALKEQADALKDELKKDMADMQEITTKHFTIKNTQYTASRFDSTSFKKDHPELATQYTKETTASRFSIKAS